MFLARLKIDNLALVESLDVEFEPRLIAVTGETGAGKSMILGSLMLLLGQRAESGLVRKGAKRASVEAVFDLSGGIPAALASALRDLGIELEPNEPLILRRDISDNSRAAAQIAGRLVSVRQLGELTALLLDIHSQHDQQSLTQRRWQRDVLDAFAGAASLADTVRSLFDQWSAAQREHDDWLARERELRRNEDLLRFQLNEISQAHLNPDEEPELLVRENLLANAEKLGAAAAALLATLQNDEHGVSAALQLMQRQLLHMQQLDPRTAEWAALISSAQDNLAEFERACAAYADQLESDPAELARVQARLHLIDQLKKKYGDSIPDILAFAENVKRELADLGSFEERVQNLKSRADALRAQLEQAAAQLSARRRAAAPKLARAVEKELAQLGMEHTRLHVALQPLDALSASGAESVEFLVATNPGEDPKPLAKVASGGELSRITLALKCVATCRDDVPVLIFDEIDAGISGTVAHAVGERLRRLSANHQVFVITHMAQIAARAASHFAVSKSVSADRTAVAMTLLTGAAREDELARMLGGDSKAARAHARELLAADAAPSPSSRKKSSS